MSASHRLRDLLDPRGGDDVMRPDRRLRLNLRRVELASIALIFDAAVEGVFGYFRSSLAMMVLSGLAILGAFVFLGAAQRGQQEERLRLIWLPEIFVVVALLLSQAVGYLISLGGRIPSGYAMVYLAGAVFFLIPPRRFAWIGLGTFLIFVLWVSLLAASPFDKTVAIFNTGLAVVAGIFGRRGLHRMQETEQNQQIHIAAQNEALIAANERLGRANAELASLMAIAAHDLRSPLFGLRNLLDLAASRLDASSHALHDLLREASESITVMLALVGRLLEAHETEGRAARLREGVDLGKSLERARQRSAATAAGSGIRMKLEVPPHPVQITADVEALDQIFDNLVSNAIRFSPSGSTIRLLVGIEEMPFAEVIDEGVGIPAEEREQLFGKFRRGATRPVHGPRGSGLGLYIVHTLSQAMGAEVNYRPAATGGSIFRVRFSGAITPASI
ncbi:sensor histidine kinase [Ancylobacter mangrovi]|uniref:sensor histidine kinase n=1 Tax=Ancylobacter mangrovi TaxID=2972472 RepID=UPI002162E139|nr:HAMP domain-containing sensor histidine kinase [Ancylobacter mangrovi]MCS0505157.1 HAMP domain-containing histidine kinase [Ancylobacter mangrovi]